MRMQRIGVALTAINFLLLLAVSVRPRPTAADASIPVLRGRAFELVDERGQVRSRLDVEANGEVVLRLLDQHGTIRVKLGAAADGSGLVLLNDATEPGVHLLAKGTGSSLKLANKDGRERVITP